MVGVLKLDRSGADWLVDAAEAKDDSKEDEAKSYEQTPHDSPGPFQEPLPSTFPEGAGGPAAAL